MTIRIAQLIREKKTALKLVVLLNAMAILPMASAEEKKWYPGWPSPDGVFYSDQFRPDERTNTDMTRFQVYQFPGYSMSPNGWVFRPVPKRAPYRDPSTTTVAPAPWRPPMVAPPYAANYGYPPYRRSRPWWNGFFGFMPMW